jgi:SAM-dependent methyltransferase
MSSLGLETLSSSMTQARAYTQWVFDEFKPYVGKRVMEVGLGYGNFTPFLVMREAYMGVDLDGDVVALASRSYPMADFLVSDISHARFVEEVGARRFDTVLCINVLEHIPEDSAAIRNLLAVLDRGGRLLLFVPAYQFLYTDLDRLAGHLRRYNRTKLARALPATGVTVEKLEYFNPVGALGWWAQKFLRHESLESEKISNQVKMFDRYILPVSRRLNILTKHWFGQSMIGVIRKG